MKEIDIISEKVEWAVLNSLAECCPAETKKAIGFDCGEISDGLVLSCTGDESILLNRVMGLGSEHEVSLETIKAVEAHYSAKDISNYFIHIYEDAVASACRDYLNGPGFIKKRGWMKFKLHMPERREVATELRVEKVGIDRGADFAAIVCTAFEMEERSVPLLSALAHDDRWHLFVSYAGDQPAGAGALFVDGKYGWLDWAGTTPEFRRRGSQGAVMAARLTLASELGCEVLFTETGEAVEGDPQHSYRNILKAGFEEAVLRSNYAPNRG